MEKKRNMKAIIIIAVIVVAVFSIGAVEYTSQVGFCNSCHEMNVPFSGWETGVHQDKHCYECHTDEGVIAKAKVKVNGLKEVYIHLTEEVNMDEIVTDIPSARCEKCHNLSDEEKYNERTIKFHNQHAGYDYDCMTCHRSVGHTDKPFNGFNNDSCKQCHPIKWNSIQQFLK